MIAGGIPTIFVSNMDAAVRFYSDSLGLKLKARYGDHWAEVDAGGGLVIGLHPASPTAGPPGTRGAIAIGLYPSRPLNEVHAELQKRGVRFDGPIVDDPKGGVRLAHFSDPDGNPLYLCEVKH